MFRGLAWVALLAAQASCARQYWVYPDVLERGPADWGSLTGASGATLYPTCKAGQAQSPVNIAGAAADPALAALGVHHSAAAGLRITNTQQHIAVAPQGAGGGHIIDPNQGGRRYDFKEMIVRSPSEHALGGGLLDMEVQFVHEEAQAQPAGATVDGASKKVIVSVLFAAGTAPNAHFSFFDRLPTRPDAAFAHYADVAHDIEHKTVDVNAAFHFGQLFGGGQYYTYTGSDTAPPCTEDVTWYVMQDVNSVSTAQLDALRTAMDFTKEEAVAKDNAYAPGPYHVHGNARPEQPLHGRTVRAFTDCGSLAPHPSDDDHTHFVLGLIGTILGGTSLLLLCIVMVISKKADKGRTEPHA
eukprot:TRINITY_DN6304_c0_g1_i1.p3 TRINITY_DN6304_c0_g1~~TRINITY_DN6304_c0_g1_i1.p3  ORF type:complete len:356 (+),score=105.77 TRINITY_DN6304_c0_g1_i1:1605-2672(+)